MAYIQYLLKNIKTSFLYKFLLNDKFEANFKKT